MPFDESILDNFDKSRLFFTYGSAVYLPKVSEDSGVAYDDTAKSLSRVIREHRRSKDPSDTSLYSAHRDNDALGNPLGDVIPERTLTVSAKNRIRKFDDSKKKLYYYGSTGVPHVQTFSGTTSAESSGSLLVTTLSYKIPASGVFRGKDGKDIEGEKWDAEALSAKYYSDPEDKSADARRRRRAIALEAPVSTSSEGIPLFLYAKNKDFRRFVLGEISRIYEAIHPSSSTGVVSVPVVSKSYESPRSFSQTGSYLSHLLLAAFYSSDYDKHLEEQKEQSSLTKEVDSASAPEVPHLGKDVSFLPHQSYAHAFMQDRKSAFIDADPGAGKTLMMLADILHQMDTNKVRRPCIIMPNSLLGDQKVELQAWTNNSINFIVLNTATIRRMDPEAEEYTSRTDSATLTKPGDWSRGLQEAIKLVSSAPPNTIVLTSYRWLISLTKEEREQVKRDKVDATFPMPNVLVDDMGIDMVVLDESHGVRYNSRGGDMPTSLSTLAVMQLSSMVEYKRCFSGSIAPNTPEDVFLQTAFLDPSVFGSIDNFRKEYGESWARSGKVEVWGPGAIKTIRAKLNSSLGLSIRRSAWIHLLPELTTTHHYVELSPAQRKLYNILLTENVPNWSVNEETSQIELTKDPEAWFFRKKEEIMLYLKDSGLDDLPAIANTFLESSLGDGMIEAVRTDDDSVDTEARKRLIRKHLSSTFMDDPDFKQVLAKAARLRAEVASDYARMYNNDEISSPILIAKYAAFDTFLGDPGSYHKSQNEGGGAILPPGEERISPKIPKINEIIRKHFADPENGKLIVFTGYKKVAAHIYENLDNPSDAVYYDASNKDVLDSFKHDPNIKIIVAVVKSIEMGQNLQMANRIIQVDLPWMPGSYDQSVARSYRLRPRDPNAASYDKVYVDVILTNGTVDVTKHARLVSKMHKTKMLTSEYSSDENFKLISMKPSEIWDKNTSDFSAVYVKVFNEMSKADKADSKRFMDKFGTAERSLGTGKKLKGSEHIVTPYTNADVLYAPRLSGPTPYTMGVIDPKLTYFDMGWWLSFSMGSKVGPLVTGLSGLRRDFAGSSLSKQFHSPAEFGKLVDSLASQRIRVSNLSLLASQANKSTPLNMNYSGAMVRYAGVTKTAAAELPVVNGSTRRLILGAEIDPSSLSEARRVLELAAAEVGDTSAVSDLAVFFVAKYLTALNLSVPSAPDTDYLITLQSRARSVLSLRSFSSKLTAQMKAMSVGSVPSTDTVPDSSIVTITPSARLVPEEQAVAVDPQESHKEMVTDSDAGPDLTMDAPDSAVSFDEETDAIGANFEIILSRGGTPLAPERWRVDLALPAVTTDKSTMSALQGRLSELGFAADDIPGFSNASLFYIGESASSVRKGLVDFSRRIYRNGYALSDLDEFIDVLSSAGVPTAEVDSIFGSLSSGSRGIGSGALDDVNEEEETDDSFNDTDVEDILSSDSSSSSGASPPVHPAVPPPVGALPVDHISGEDPTQPRRMDPNFIPKNGSYRQSALDRKYPEYAELTRLIFE